jgi:RimJ/RimL family protein N-acetyltransferase
MIYYSSDLREYFGLQFAMWKMALLDPMNRNKGLGTDFFIACLHYHREEGLDVVDSGLSIRNLSSLNLHIKLNFKITSTLVTLHKWL